MSHMATIETNFSDERALSAAVLRFLDMGASVVEPIRVRDDGFYWYGEARRGSR
jgi:hypothetical protein